MQSTQYTLNNPIIEIMFIKILKNVIKHLQLIEVYFKKINGKIVDKKNLLEKDRSVIQFFRIILFLEIIVE